MQQAAGVKNLRLKFPGTENLLFKDFSLSVKKGEKVLILGPSGSGKSTLLQVLTGLIPNTVHTPMKAEAVQTPNSWGFVFQDPDTQFCMPYVDEEIAFVLENLQVPREKMEGLIRSYLRQAGLEFANIHTPVQTLSGGMKQRLAIASVLALEPDVLVLDEPTAMLDPEGTKEVWKTIKDIGQERTVIIVEHKIEQIIDFIDRIVLLNNQGEILADGSRQEVFGRFRDTLEKQGIWYPGIWEEYLEKQPAGCKQTNQIREKPALSLTDFAGYRGREKKLEIKRAEVFPGDWIAVTGKNGAGKSTLLHALMNLIKTTGSYQVFGREYKKVTKWNDYLAFVFQNPEFQFVTNTVYDEIAYTLELEKWPQEEITDRVSELLKYCRLENHASNHPYQLSMGQKRRLSVAAAIVKEQPVILLDEPTFGQDASNTFAILEQLESWRQQGTAIIMATHDLEIVRNFATRCWEMENGRLKDKLVGVQPLEIAGR